MRTPLYDTKREETVSVTINADLWDKARQWASTCPRSRRRRSRSSSRGQGEDQAEIDLDLAAYNDFVEEQARSPTVREHMRP